MRYNGGTTPTRYRYTGQYSYTAEFGLYFYNARWYDPSLGRFAQPDTLVPETQGVQAWDRYAYVNNNPLRYADPSGHWLETAWDIFSIGLDLYTIRQEGLTWQNGLALVVDVGTAILPGVPAFAGVLIKGGKAAKATVEVATHADEVADAARLLSNADEVVDALRGVENATEAVGETSGLPRRFSRFMSRSELEAVEETGLLRGGRPGDTYFTTNKYRTVRSAEEKLALPYAPEVRLDFEMVNQPRVYGPRTVAPAFGKPGGGIEYWSPDPVRVRIIRWRDLR